MDRINELEAKMDLLDGKMVSIYEDLKQWIIIDR